MANIIRSRIWRVRESELTDERAFMNRRRFMQVLGAAGAAPLAVGPAAAAAAEDEAELEKRAMEMVAEIERQIKERGLGDPRRPAAGGEPAEGLYPADLNAKFKLGHRLTPELIPAVYNNFYEFTTDKERVWSMAAKHDFRPWSLEVGGLCESPRTMDIDEIEKLAPLEERQYRFRCVEAWAMDVPWIGYPLHKLIAAAKPKPEAKFVKFISFHEKKLPGVAGQSWYPWPYYEALRMDEAMNELTLLCTGIYGHALPGQHGAPVRIITPWKYGYKSPKSVVKIEFTSERPGTFWSDLQPTEYPFESNIEPTVPHPRWSQATERMIDTGARRETLKYGGYGEYVAKLYA